MDKKELKEKIEQILNNKSVLGTVGWVLEETDFEDVAEEIVNLLPIHDVMCSYDITFKKPCAEWVIKQVEAIDETEACKKAHEILKETVNDACGYKITNVKKFEP